MPLDRSAVNDCAAIVDLGKSRLKVTVMNAGGAILAERDVASSALNMQRRADIIDIDAIARWVETALIDLQSDAPFAHLIAVTHGATAVVLSDADIAQPVRDYEANFTQAQQMQYEKIRPLFRETGSPRLPLGLNLGQQLFAQQLENPASITHAKTLLTYPQYWTWRWSRALGSDVSSLGCHTDLWCPQKNCWSSLAVAQNWSRKFPPLVRAGDIAGTLLDPLHASLRASQPIQVHWGVHDSNAALAAFLTDGDPFTLLSTGTWLVAFAVGSDIDQLDAERDTLWNVDVRGRPVASARFMAGREREAIAGKLANANLDDLRALLQTDAIALPAFAAGGCFPERRGQIISTTALTDPMRAALASLYLALMADQALELIGARGPIIIEGPLAQDEAALCALAALRPTQTVAITHTNCVAHGAARLLFSDSVPLPATRSITIPTDLVNLIHARRARWRRLIEEL